MGRVSQDHLDATIKSGTRLLLDSSTITRFQNLSYLPIDLPVAQEAASLRAHFGLGSADALTVAAALVGQTNYIVTADRAWMSKLKAIETRVKLVCIA